MNNEKISRKINKRQQVKYAMRYMDRPINLSTKSDLDELRKELRSIKPLYKRQENRKEQHESIK